MQHRMKTHPLTEDRINHLLAKAQTGSLATLNPDGTPYVTPVHFVCSDGNIYVHGLVKGQKIDNILRDGKVGFSVYDMQGFLLDPDEQPCDTNTEYESVIVTGNASLLEDTAEKQTVLRKIVEKYTPHLKQVPFPESMVRGTAVIAIRISEITGKYYA